MRRAANRPFCLLFSAVWGLRKPTRSPLATNPIKRKEFAIKGVI